MSPVRKDPFSSISCFKDFLFCRWCNGIPFNTANRNDIFYVVVCMCVCVCLCVCVCVCVCVNVSSFNTDIIFYLSGSKVPVHMGGFFHSFYPPPPPLFPTLSFPVQLLNCIAQTLLKLNIQHLTGQPKRQNKTGTDQQIIRIDGRGGGRGLGRWGEGDRTRGKHRERDSIKRR